MKTSFDRIRDRVGKDSSPSSPSSSVIRRIVNPYTSFPVEHLPPSLRQVVTSTAQAVGCDPTFAVLPALALAGASIGAAMAISPKPRFIEIPVIWVVAIGDSGTAKSPASDPFVGISHDIEDQLDNRHKDSVRQWAERDDGEKSVPEPSREYFVADDVTVERLIENLNSSPRGILLVQDELANWFGSFARYKGKSGGSDSAKWLNMFDGRSVSYQRRTGSPRDVRVKRACVSVSGGIQPDILRTAMQDPAYVASGLAARLLFAMPPKKCPRWNEHDPDQESTLRFGEIIASLRKIPFDPKRGPNTLGLEYEARKRYIRFSDEFMARAENLDGGPMASALPKLARYALRFGLIHHAVSRAAADVEPWKDCVSETSMVAGIAIAEWFAHEAERVYSMLAEAPEDAVTRRLAEYVRKKGGTITPRDLQRARGDLYPSSQHAELALEAAVAACWGVWKETKPTSGGHPVRTFTLYPTPDTRPE